MNDPPDPARERAGRWEASNDWQADSAPEALDLIGNFGYLTGVGLKSTSFPNAASISLRRSSFRRP